ncbi:metal ABC transporter permease, partial [Candidatus Bathyarchaeota archaeon]
IVMMSILDVVILLVVFTFYKELLALAFDEEFVTVRGVPTKYVYLTLLSMVALTVVVLIRIVGVILVIAMLTIPATIAWQFSHKLHQIMLYSTILSAFFITCGLWLSYVFNSASGATIVLVSVAVFILSLTLNFFGRGTSS